MAAIRLQVSCKRTNRRATRRILSLPPWRCWLTTLSASFPTASKPLARLSNKLPDENSSDHSRNSSAVLLQLDEQDGDEENYLPASLALLLDYIMCKFLVALKPLARPSTRRFMSLGLRSFVQESSQRSSNISWFDHVQFACASTQSRFEPRFYEGKSFSSIMPSISKVMRVYHSPCQEWGLKVISQRYDLMSSRPSDTRSVPIPVGDAAVLEETLRSAFESYTFQLRTLTALFRFSGDSGQISLGAVAFVATRRGEPFLSHMGPSVTKVQKQNLLSDPIFQREDLFAPATIGAARHAAKDVSLFKGAQSRPSTSSGMTQRRPSSSSSASRGHTQSSSAPATPQRSQASSSSKRFTPQKKSPDPPGGFSGVGVCPLFVVL